MRALRRLGAVVALAVAASLAGATPVWAHAALTGTDPVDGARLDASPATVTLRFNEPVTPSGGDSVTVVGADGERVDDGLADDGAGQVLTARLPASLPDGGYVVSFAVVSADGHVIRGASTFRVGDGGADVTASAGSAAGSSRTLDATGSVIRSALYLTALLAVGGVVFLLVVARRRVEVDAYTRVVAGAAAVAVLATVAGWLVHTVQASVDGAAALLSADQLADVADQPFGRGSLVRLAGLFAVVAGAGAWTKRWAPPFAAAGALVTVVSFALDGHAAATEPRWLVVLSDLVHTASAAAWFGGLVLLGLALRARRHDERPEEAGGLVARFSGVATVAVVGVGVAGIALGWAEVRSLDALVSTAYGWTLLAKVVVVAAVGAVGLHNNRRLVPSLRHQPAGDAWGSLRRTVRLEVVGLIVAVAVTGFLVNIVPARTAAAEADAGTAAGPFETAVGLGAELHGEVVVDPAQRGANELTLTVLTHANQPPVEGPQEVTFDLSQPDAGIGPISRTATKLDESRFVADVDDLVVAGDWLVEIEARIDDFVLERAQFTVAIP